MNPYTLRSRLRVGDKITFRPRFSSKIADGEVLAIALHEGALPDEDRVRKVYVKYLTRHNFKDETRHQWVTPRRVFHIIDDMTQQHHVFTPDPRCDRPPVGWFCTRGLDHDGPCAAWPGEPHA